jgi:hypothetical protein
MIVMPHKSKKEKAAYMKKYWAERPGSRPIGRNQRLARNRKYVEDYKRSHPCVDCGESDPVCLDFDHRDAVEKRVNVSKILSREASLETLAEEIAKCDMRCANCHRRRTAKQQNWHIYRKAA